MSDDIEGALQGPQVDSGVTERQQVHRGQVEPRFVVGIILVVVLAVPLAKAAAQVQSSLASTPAFSWWTGGLVAVLIVGAIVAAIFE